MRLAIGLAAGVALLLGATDAQAAQRYAAPDGTGSACTQEQPCSLADASNEASKGDEVIVTAGDYTISGAPLNVVYAGLQFTAISAGRCRGCSLRSEGCRRST